MRKTLNLLTDSYTAVFGVNDQLSAMLESALEVRLRMTDGQLLIEGEDGQAELAAQCTSEEIGCG